jgi:hypothetical protein
MLRIGGIVANYLTQKERVIKAYDSQKKAGYKKRRIIFQLDSPRWQFWIQKLNKAKPPDSNQTPVMRFIVFRIRTFYQWDNWSTNLSKHQVGYSTFLTR